MTVQEQMPWDCMQGMRVVRSLYPHISSIAKELLYTITAHLFLEPFGHLRNSLAL